MFRSIALSLALTAAAIAPAAAHDFGQGFNRAPAPLLGALVSVGPHGSIANVGAAVGASSRHGSSLADVNVNALNGAVRADVDVGQSSRHSSTLLGVSATVLDGGVGHRGGW